MMANEMMKENSFTPFTYDTPFPQGYKTYKERIIQLTLILEETQLSEEPL